jgi:hypothetical protein
MTGMSKVARKVSTVVGVGEDGAESVDSSRDLSEQVRMRQKEPDHPQGCQSMQKPAKSSQRTPKQAKRCQSDRQGAGGQDSKNGP